MFYWGKWKSIAHFSNEPSLWACICFAFHINRSMWSKLILNMVSSLFDWLIHVKTSQNATAFPSLLLDIIEAFFNRFWIGSIQALLIYPRFSSECCFFMHKFFVQIFQMIYSRINGYFDECRNPFNQFQWSRSAHECFSHREKNERGSCITTSKMCSKTLDF